MLGLLSHAVSLHPAGYTPAVELSFTNLGRNTVGGSSLFSTIMSVRGTFTPDMDSNQGTQFMSIQGMDCTLHNGNSTEYYPVRYCWYGNCGYPYYFPWYYYPYYYGAQNINIPPGASITCVTTPQDVRYISTLPPGNLTVRATNFMRQGPYGTQQELVVFAQIPRSPHLSVHIDSNACRPVSSSGKWFP
jgi:hypothetical protein